MLNKYADTGISPRVDVYAERKMLKTAMPVMVLEKFGLSVTMPKNKSTTIKFRRAVAFTAATTPLVEGVTPNADAFDFEDVTGTLRQYGQVVGITDVIADTHEDPVLNTIAEQLGENIGRTMEALTWAVVRAGTNVLYANGASRSAVNTPISLAKQRKAVRALKAQKAQKHTRILSGSPDHNTSPIEASFIAVAHTDLEADIRNLTGFVPVSQYGSRQMLSEHEIGAVEDVRYVLSPDLDAWADAGGAAGSMLSTTGTSADVYPVIYLGKEAFGHVALRGAGAISPTIIPVGQRTKDDPLGQRGYAGWKAWHLAMILNESWMIRLEVAATAL